MKFLGKALKWNELANIYDASHPGRCARTMRMETIFEWAERQTDKFKVTKEGTIHRKIPMCGNALDIEKMIQEEEVK